MVEFNNELTKYIDFFKEDKIYEKRWVLVVSLAALPKAIERELTH